MIHSKEPLSRRNDLSSLKLHPAPGDDLAEGNQPHGTARAISSKAAPHSDSLIAIDRDMSSYEREATEVRKFLADVTRRGGELKNEPRWRELRGDWDHLNDRASEIEERACALKAKTAEGLKVKQRVAAWLRIRAPGLDRPEFAQRVVDSMRDDALAMALN
jgi:hypothetical protein